MLRSAVLALSLLAAPETPTSDPSAAPPAVVIHVYPEDGGAAATATKTLDVLSRRATAEGWKVTSEPRVSELLDRSPEDLVRAANARDMDLAMTHYTSMTNSCYQCHRYVRNARIAGR